MKLSLVKKIIVIGVVAIMPLLSFQFVNAETSSTHHEMMQMDCEGEMGCSSIMDRECFEHCFASEKSTDTNNEVTNTIRTIELVETEPSSFELPDNLELKKITEISKPENLTQLLPTIQRE